MDGSGGRSALRGHAVRAICCALAFLFAYAVLTGGHTHQTPARATITMQEGAP